MVAFPPAKGFKLETHVIAGHRVLTATSRYLTASVSTKGVAADIEFPDPQEVVSKVVKFGVDKFRKPR